MILQTIADKLTFFTEFEQTLSFWYLSILFGFFFYLFYQKKKSLFHKKDLYPIIFVIIIGLYVIINFSPFADTLDSRSEDYKLAAKYFAESREYKLCSNGNTLTCFEESTMEKAPAYSYALSLFFILFGSSSSVAVVFNIIIAIFSFVFFYKTISILTKNNFVAILFTVLLIINITFLQYTTQTENINFTSFLIILGFFFIVKNKIDLAAITFLIVTFTRAEYILFFIIFFIINFKKIKSKKFILIFFLIISLHSLTEGRYHTSSSGEYLNINNFIERVVPIVKNSLHFYSLLLLVPFINFKNRNVKYLFGFLALQFVLILSFQFNGYLRYSAPLIAPSLIFVSLGANKIFNITKVYGKKLGYIALLIIFGLYLSLNPLVKSDFGMYSSNNIDIVLNGFEDGVFFTHNQPINSHLILDTNLTAIIAQNTKTVVEETKTSKNKYLLKIPPEIHKEETDYIFNNFETTLVKESGELKLYKIN